MSVCPHTSGHPIISTSPMHLYATYTFVHPPYICTSSHTSVCPSTFPICLYAPIHLYTPIYLYAPHTAVHPTVHPPYICMPQVYPHMSVCGIHLYTPPYICTPPNIYTFVRYNSILQYWVLPVSNICFYHCSRTNCRLYVSKNLYKNLDLCLAAKQYIKLQFMGT